MSLVSIQQLSFFQLDKVFGIRQSDWKSLQSWESVEFLGSHETTAQCCDSSFSVRVAQLVASILISTSTSHAALESYQSQTHLPSQRAQHTWDTCLTFQVLELMLVMVVVMLMVFLCKMFIIDIPSTSATNTAVQLANVTLQAKCSRFQRGAFPFTGFLMCRDLKNTTQPHDVALRCAGTPSFALPSATHDRTSSSAVALMAGCILCTDVIAESARTALAAISSSTCVRR